jgi:hypothetical protein
MIFSTAATIDGGPVSVVNPFTSSPVLPFPLTSLLRSVLIMVLLQIQYIGSEALVLYDDDMSKYMPLNLFC